ncbi:hypothetical protein ACFWUP_00085 [Nocardia sp. NPDC058658]|uniref:hypothetical protein n=1 Tax=Nocardia sp. NPDC058658 TaxID=3346580 RepID=UPI00365854A3
MTEIPHLVVDHHLELLLDYSHFILHGGEGAEDAELTLLDAAFAHGPSAGDGHTVVVISPQQTAFDMPIRIQVWDQRPADDGNWQQVSEARLRIGEHGLTISSPVDGWAQAPVPPGDYLAEIAGTDFAKHGEPGDHWRIRLWPDDGASLRPPRIWEAPESDTSTNTPPLVLGTVLDPAALPQSRQEPTITIPFPGDVGGTWGVQR